jgi:NitT/TauT family transport system ATP-binding protein
MLSVERLHKMYAGLKVMEDFSLELEEGQIHCLFGPSGCGKTTLLRMLAGLTAPDAGSIRLPQEELRFAMVFQEDRLLPWLTVRDNIAYALESRLGRAAALVEADRCGQRVGLGDFLGALPSQLSGGMQRRVAIARALVCQAELLFLDEPFKGLDYSLKQELMGLVREECLRTGQTVLLVTHDPEEAYCLADRVYMVEGPPLAVAKELDVAAFRREITGEDEGTALQRFRILLTQPGRMGIN